MGKGSTDKTKSIVSIDSSKNVMPSSVSLSKVIELSKMLSKGKSRQYVIEYAMSHYNVNEAQARRYYSAAARYLLPDDVEEFRKGLIQANMDRLETIIERCMEEGQWKVAREAIDSLNKMFGVTGGVQVGIATDKENNTQQIVIKFDN